MKTHIKNHAWALAPLIVVPVISAHADEVIATREIQLTQPERHLDRFSVSYSAGWNIKANFSGIGFNPAQSSVSKVPADQRRVNRRYDDGSYVGVDSTGNAAGYTTYWGYQSSSQISGDTLVMESRAVHPGARNDVSDDPQHGFQLTWNHELWRDKKDCLRWGIEGGFGWNDIRIGDNRPTAVGVTVLRDTYSIAGITPPPPPYNGPYQQDPATPTPSIEELPLSRDVQSSAQGALVTGSRTFDADLFFFHLGPYMEFPIADKLNAVISGGFTFGVMAGHYEFDEVVAFAGGRTYRVQGERDDTDALFGGYVSATLLYQIDEHWGAFLGGQFQSLSDYDLNTGGRKASLDLGVTAFLTAGFSYSF